MKLIRCRARDHYIGLGIVVTLPRLIGGHLPSRVTRHSAGLHLRLLWWRWSWVVEWERQP